MHEETTPEGRTLVSRRGLLGGILAAAVAPALLSKAWAQPGLIRPKTPRTHIENAASGAACLPITRCQHASATLADGRILVVGGWRHSGLPAYVPPLADAQIYDPNTDIWTQAAAMKIARADHAAVALADGRVLVIGGMNSVPLATTEIYDPFADTWTEAAPMKQALYSHAASFSDGLVVVTGGFKRGPLASTQIYDVAADAWRSAR